MLLREDNRNVVLGYKTNTHIKFQIIFSFINNFSYKQNRNYMYMLTISSDYDKGALLAQIISPYGFKVIRPGPPRPTHLTPLLRNRGYSDPPNPMEN